MKSEWIWMPHAGHFICGHECRFKLSTYVNGYIISTFGELWPDSQVRKIYAKVRNIEVNGIGDAYDADYMKKIGFIEVGYGRLYETMVFKAKKNTNEKYLCCPWIADHTYGELDFEGYNSPVEAFNGHMELCEKWDLK